MAGTPAGALALAYTRRLLPAKHELEVAKASGDPAAIARAQAQLETTTKLFEQVRDEFGTAKSRGEEWKRYSNGGGLEKA